MLLSEPSNPLTVEKLKGKKKLYKQKLKEKRARLIVRNLPFTTTEENLRKHFEQYGEVQDVTVLKKPDGKLVGCGFIQFKLVQKAAKARHHANKKPFLGREIECDWALAKDKYKETVQKQKETATIKQELDEVVVKKEIKDEPIDSDETENVKVKIENLGDSEDNNDKMKVKNENEDGSENTRHEELNVESKNEEDIEENNKKDDEDQESESNELDEDEDTKFEDDEELEEDKDEGSEDDDIQNSESESIKEEKKPRVMSNDIVEGKTIFIKNVPFEATNEDLKECMRQFGPIYYALICVDKFTEHSKGTAFVKFQARLFLFLRILNGKVFD